jgi:ribonuclease HI
MVDEDTLTIYTDGSSFSKPRRGGVGVLFVHIAPDGNEVVEKIEVSGFKGATNNQMELYACIEGLKKAFCHPMLNKLHKVVIRTDSQYIASNYMFALRQWPKLKWRNKEDRPIENASLWKELKKHFLKLVNEKRVRVEIEWVESHAKDPYNKTVDKMAKASAKGILNRPLFVVQVRRKKTSEMTQVGSVDFFGQRISIRIDSAQIMQPQKIYKYTYEVTSRTSKFYGKKDIIFSSENLKSGHTYYVVFTKNKNNPEIKKVIREIHKK